MTFVVKNMCARQLVQEIQQPSDILKCGVVRLGLLGVFHLILLFCCLKIVKRLHLFVKIGVTTLKDSFKLFYFPNTVVRENSCI